MSVVHDSDTIETSEDVHDHPYDGDALDLVPGADIDFSGIDPNGIAVHGQEIVLANESDTFTVTLLHDDEGSAEGNRFFFSDGLDHVLVPLEQVWGVRRESVAGRVGWWMQF